MLNVHNDIKKEGNNMNTHSNNQQSNTQHSIIIKRLDRLETDFQNFKEARENNYCMLNQSIDGFNETNSKEHQQVYKTIDEFKETNSKEHQMVHERIDEFKALNSKEHQMIFKCIDDVKESVKDVKESVNDLKDSFKDLRKDLTLMLSIAVGFTGIFSTVIGIVQYLLIK